ncbi:heavy metal translocating P-type ATPase [Desulfitobacterium chlororespirans]|uniref:Cd(2+)-exporting ATPase n=1 Tax=Desulfitobacterium chlororespirans DSM 11544 TaxID=1121395 RepID=A0A1M7UW12_9FIRM|nr:heavy metal translocating P-type ATPase [Desulfitobacterium chlororespirans]SHN87086.1 Cd2+/Zn2+-exporting ATPase [Desulfitobacterium chlororespirans DSM 11544]
MPDSSRSQSQERVKYCIEGEFCANCSAKMERALSATEGIGETSINYAMKTVFLPPGTMGRAQAIIEKIEPGVKLVAVKEKGAVNAPEKVQYRIEGEFCPNCSAKMEQALCATEGIGETSINYAMKTVLLPPGMMSKAQEIIERIEPGVKLMPVEKKAVKNSVHDAEEEAKETKQKLLKIFIAGIFLIIGLIFGSRWHNTSLEVLEYLVFLLAYGLVGYEVLAKAFRNIMRGSVFDENFLMSIATLGAIAIHELPEAVGVMLFYAVGEYFEDRAVNRSRRSIQAVLNIRPDYANLVNGLETKKVDPDDVHIGQLILIRPGEKVPLDGEIVHGSSYVDTSALTGESVPRSVKVGDSVLAGIINTSGVLTVRVTREFADSSVQKILDLVENASARKAKTEKFITTFARYYTPAVVVIALGIALIPPLFMGGDFREWLYRAMTILVISCPCALVISVPLGYFGGIGGASRHGILVKGANYLEALTSVKTVIFDKTGTLTQGVFEVNKIETSKHYTEAQLLEIAAAAEVHSSHPIAKSIRDKWGKEIDSVSLTHYEEISGKGIRSEFKGKVVLVGKRDLLLENSIAVPELEMSEVGTQVYIGVDGEYAGVLMISDRSKEGAKEVVAQLNQAGITTVMLTGDQRSVAEAVAEQLGIREYHGDLLPEDKVTWLERYQQKLKGKGKVVFVGDGINDAPVLSRADIGVAMGGLGSDAAIEAADVVLMEDRPGKLVSAMDIAQFTKKVIWQNIGFALIIKLGFIGLGMFGVANMWEAVFADVGVALLAILNATRVRRYTRPEKPAALPSL